MIKMILKYKWYLILIIVLMILEPALNAVLNFWLQDLFNSASVGTDKIYILRLLTGGFLLWILKRIITYIMYVIRDRYVCNLKVEVKRRIFEKLLLVNTANIYESGFSGEYISMFTNDILLLEQRFFNQIIGLISAVFSILILGYSFVTLNTTLACTIIGFGFMTMLVPVFFSKMLNKYSVTYTQKIALFTQKLKEYIIAFPTIKNYSIEPFVLESFRAVNDEAENARFEADCAISLANSVGQLCAWFMQFIGVGLGIMMVVQGQILIGTVIAAQSFASDLALPIQNILINVNSIRSVKNVVKKVQTVSNRFSCMEDAVDPIECDDAPTCDRCQVQFKNLSLKLGDKKVIDDFSFTFEAGKKYLMVGVNGSGKSSVFKVLKKWYRSSAGEINLNGRPLKELSGKKLSDLVSYLNESVSMFSGTVKENITLFRNYSDSDLHHAITEAHLQLDPDHKIDDEGRNISSGEQRRIEIARALLRNTPVLIFDEVISTLDVETAYEIERHALELKNKTVIFISHNFSGALIDQYDEILVMDKGRLIASGKYGELLEICPYFKRICKIKVGTLSTGN